MVLIIYIKDFGTHASTANIILAYTNNNTLDGHLNVNLNKNSDVLSYVYYGFGSNGRWIKMNQNPSLSQVDHTTLSNIGTTTHANIDLFIASKSQSNGLCALDADTKVPTANIPTKLTTTNEIEGDVLRYSEAQTKYINSNALTTAVSDIVNLKKKTDCTKDTTVAINDTIVTDYNDDLPCQMIYVDNTEPYYYDRLTAINHNKNYGSGGTLAISGTYNFITSTANNVGFWLYGSTTSRKLNIEFEEAIKVSQVKFTTMNTFGSNGNITISVYGSNNVNDYNDLTSNVTGLVLLNSGLSNANVTITITTNDT